MNITRRKLFGFIAAGAVVSTLPAGAAVTKAAEPKPFRQLLRATFYGNNATENSLVHIKLLGRNGKVLMETAIASVGGVFDYFPDAMVFDSQDSDLIVEAPDCVVWELTFKDHLGHTYVHERNRFQLGVTHIWEEV